MATLKQEDYNKPDLFVIEQAENKILSAQRNSKVVIPQYKDDDMYSSTLTSEEFAILRQAEDINTCDKRIVNLFSMRSVF